jgi:hypothetical protein
MNYDFFTKAIGILMIFMAIGYGGAIISNALIIDRLLEIHFEKHLAQLKKIQCPPPPCASHKNNNAHPKQDI